MHTVLPSVCFSLGASREIDRGPLLPCDHRMKEGQRLLQQLFGFVPDPGAQADIFSAHAGEKVSVNVWWEGDWFPPGVGSYCVAMPSETALSCVGWRRAGKGQGAMPWRGLSPLLGGLPVRGWCHPASPGSHLDRKAV